MLGDRKELVCLASWVILLLLGLPWNVFAFLVFYYAYMFPRDFIKPQFMLTHFMQMDEIGLLFFIGFIACVVGAHINGIWLLKHIKQIKERRG